MSRKRHLLKNGYKTLILYVTLHEADSLNFFGYSKLPATYTFTSSIGSIILLR